MLNLLLSSHESLVKTVLQHHWEKLFHLKKIKISFKKLLKPADFNVILLGSTGNSYSFYRLILSTAKILLLVKCRDTLEVLLAMALFC